MNICLVLYVFTNIVTSFFRGDLVRILSAFILWKCALHEGWVYALLWSMYVKTMNKCILLIKYASQNKIV
jgi:hypothetical protein